MGNNLNYMRRRLNLGAQPHKAKASGAVATFRTNLAARLDSLFVDVTPVQDLHGQQYPYPAGGGKNKLNAVTSNSLNYGGNYTNYTIDDATGVVTVTNGTSMGFIVPVTPNGQYVFSYVKSSAESINTRVREYSGKPTSWTDNFIEQSVNVSNAVSGRISETFTVGANTTYIICSVYHGSTATNLALSEWQCEAGATATAYAPYSNVCPITGWAAAKVESAPNMDIGTLYNNGLDDYGEVNTYTYYWHTDYIDVRNAEQVEIAFYAIDSGWTYRVCAYDANKQFIELLDKKTHQTGRAYSYTYDSTALDGVVYLRFSFVKNGGNPTVKHFAVVDSLQVIQFGQTLYGARIDWNGRKAVCDRALSTLGKSDVFSVVQASTGIWYARFYILPGCTFSTVSGKTNEVKSNMYTSAFGAGTDNAVRLINGYPYVYNSKLDTLAKAEEFYLNNPLQIWYPLATPVEIPLDLVDFVTVPGINNVFADCGNVDLSYWTNI